MNRTYQTPTAEVIRLDAPDVVCDSGDNDVSYDSMLSGTSTGTSE